MESAAITLTELGISFEVELLSAHRMPDEMMAFGKAAVTRGFKVIIAGAGGAAHLPGMLASITPLPVIGVPIPLKALDGMDSLLSIVQMPAGIPVATVGIGNAKNAGLLAARILGAHNSSALKAITEQMAKMHTDVLGRAENLKRTSQGE
jgi:5-(carboxyamino)imidazole ribonucleotide mutase